MLVVNAIGADFDGCTFFAKVNPWGSLGPAETLCSVQNTASVSSGEA